MDAVRHPSDFSEAERRIRATKQATLHPARRYLTLLKHNVQQMPCQNCGAKAGAHCKRDYGCIDTDRRNA